jgi:hypothetical protein
MAKKLYFSVFPGTTLGSPPPEVVRAAQQTIVGAGFPAGRVSRDANVACIGSCFAGEISKVLKALGIKTEHAFIGERWNSAFALDHFLARLLEKADFPEGFLESSEDLTQQLGAFTTSVTTADLYILTFGLSLCWFDKQGRLVLEPGKTDTEKGLFSAIKRCMMVQTTVEQNEAAILSCIDRVKKHNPYALIAITLSPVPMLASMTTGTIIQQNTVSKATLRLALERVKQRQLPDVFYWPSYEIVNWYGLHVDRSFGGDAMDSRHVLPNAVELATSLFVDNFFAPVGANASTAAP